MTGHRVCPWWVDLLATPFRRLMQDPTPIVTLYVRAGMTVLEPGPGTLELGRLVGPSGRVIVVDVQPQMIAGLRRRTRRAGLLDRIDARVVLPTSMGLDDVEGAVDFVFAFAVVHEMPGPGPFFSEAAGALKPGALMVRRHHENEILVRIAGRLPVHALHHVSSTPRRPCRRERRRLCRHVHAFHFLSADALRQYHWNDRGDGEKYEYFHCSLHSGGWFAQQRGATTVYRRMADNGEAGLGSRRVRGSGTAASVGLSTARLAAMPGRLSSWA
jgi:SAM-dependent methyltransferase